MNAELFWYWINERQKIYLKKERGDPKPWTKDPFLREYKFTNVFREQDRVTVELRKRINKRDNQLTILWKIILFRMFNWPDTYDELNKRGKLVSTWNERAAKKLLHQRAERGDKIFTGAYIITNAGSKRPKIDLICEALTVIWKERKQLLFTLKQAKSLEVATDIFTDYPHIGKFIAYELVTDLRHTSILNKAKDIYGWANPGPGAKRGLNRIFRDNVNIGTTPEGYQWEMLHLLTQAPKHLDKKIFEGHTLEMRDIEHSLCEYDKYMRLHNGEGRPRSKYDGTAN